MTRRSSKRMSARHARTLAEELETSRGRLASLVEAYPELREESQRALREACGETIACFRHVRIREGEKLRSEGVVSTTLSPRYVAKLMVDAPGVVMTWSAPVQLRPVLMRYDVPIERVLLYVPVAIDRAKKERGQALARMRVRGRGGKLSGSEVLDLAAKLDEQEVLIDASGLSATVLEPGSTEEQQVLRQWVDGEVKTGMDVLHAPGRQNFDIEELPEGRWRFVPIDMAAHARRYDELLDRIKMFFDGACDT